MPSVAGLCAGITWGKATNSADVTGAVTDTSGAVVPGVTVTVADIGKNTERTLTTSDSDVSDTGTLGGRTIPIGAKQRASAIVPAEHN